MASCWSRERLYEAVWGEPISTLGPKWNVSDADLKKLAQKPKIAVERTRLLGKAERRPNANSIALPFDPWG
jgi:hypothetical protein